MKNKILAKDGSDINLYRSFLKGNNDDFNTLILKYRKQLTMFIYKYVKNIENAEDIAQDSFVYMLINKIDYDFKYSFRTYLFTIAKSRTLNYLKKNKIIPIVGDELTIANLEAEVNIEQDYIRKEEYLRLYQAIRKLKTEYQVVIYLHNFQGFKYDEICEILNQSMSKTKVMIHRAKKELKNF